MSDSLTVSPLSPKRSYETLSGKGSTTAEGAADSRITPEAVEKPTARVRKTVAMPLPPVVAGDLPTGPAEESGRVVVRAALPPDECQRIDCGLSEAQKQALFDLTGGSVDFRHMYRVSEDALEKGDRDPGKRVQILGKEGPVAPPPFTLTEVAPGTPADPEFRDQWWPKALKVTEAWALATGKGITIADCDAGWYVKERDIRANLLLDKGRDVADRDKPTVIDDGAYVSHGTAVAAIMTGVKDGAGTNGIAYDAKIVPIQNFNYDSSLDDIDKEEATAQAILAALEHPEVRVIVLENQTAMGSSETHPATREAVKLALQAGVTVVSAGGNYQKRLDIEKAFDTGSIIVGAVDRGGTKADFSNYGPRVSVAAYGEDLYTLEGPDGRMGNFGGTSGATPQVAAAVAMMLEVNPQLSPADVRRILEATRDTTPTNAEVGGVLDIPEALRMAKATPADAAAAEARLALRTKIASVLARA